MTNNAEPPVEGTDTGGASGTPPAAPPAGGEPPKSPSSSAEGDSTPASPPPPASDSFAIPEAYKEKPWAAKIKTPDDMWKQIDNLQIAVGKKTVVPNLAEATPEEREAYYANFRPENQEAYGLAEVSPDVILPSVRDALSKGLLENGVSPVQAKPILEAIAAASLKEKEIAFSAEDFTAKAEEVLGKGYDPKPLQATLKSTLSAETYKGLMEGVPNANLVQIHKAMQEVVKAYGIKESGAHTDAGHGQQKVADPAARSKQLMDEIVAMSKRPHTAEEKQKLIDERNAIFTQLASKQGA